MSDQVKQDDQGRWYLETTREVHGQQVPVRIYGEQGQRPKQYVK